MTFKHYKHLNVPDSWERYFTKYPQGMSILEALFEWVSQVDSMVDNQNNLNDNVRQFRKEINVFVERFDDRLQAEVTTTLKDWQDSGFLDVVISEALQWQLDDYIQTNENDKTLIDKEIEKLEHTTDVYISPKNFNSLRECYLYAWENAKVIKADKLTLTENTSFRGVGLEINEVNLNGFTLELGDFNENNPQTNSEAKVNRPSQTISNIIGVRNSRNELFIRGSCYQEITINHYRGYIQMRLNNAPHEFFPESTYQASFIAYSTFNFGNVLGIEIGNDPGYTTSTERVLWCNENVFHLGNTIYFIMGNEGQYQHNLNRIYGGCFEGDTGLIHIHSGASNYFYDIRAEGKMSVKCDDQTRNNYFEFLHHYFKPYVSDLGFNNVFVLPRTKNPVLVSHDQLSTNAIPSGTRGVDYENVRPFRNLIYEEVTRSFMKGTTETFGNIIYETPFLSDPENIRLTVLSHILDGSLSVGYKYYNSDYTDITTTIANIGFTSHVLTTGEGYVDIQSEGGYRGPSTGLTGYRNGEGLSAIKNDIFVFEPGGQWINNIASDQVKYIKFFVSLYDETAPTIRIKDVTVLAHDISGNMHTKYFNDYISL